MFLRLDLSENCIDAEMSGVMHGIARNKSIVSLNVSKNMTGIKPKYLPNVMEAIVQLLQVTNKHKIIDVSLIDRVPYFS